MFLYLLKLFYYNVFSNKKQYYIKDTLKIN